MFHLGRAELKEKLLALKNSSGYILRWATIKQLIDESVYFHFSEALSPQQSPTCRSRPVTLHSRAWRDDQKIVKQTCLLEEGWVFEKKNSIYFV